MDSAELMEMKIEPNIGTFQKQTLAISTQALQSLSILQFSQEELQGYLVQQAERNPLVELAENGPPTFLAHDPAGKERTAPAVQVRNHAQPFGGDSAGRGPASRNTEIDSIALLQEARPSLHDHLRAQARMKFRDNRDLLVATEIIEAIEGNGYLGRDIEDIAEMLGIPPARAETVLNIVQTFDPVGIAARSLAECLKLQLQDRGRLTPSMQQMLDNLDLLAAFDYPRLARLCRTTQEEINRMVREIRTLDPRPGCRFDADPVLPALPDVIVSRRKDGSFAIELCTQLLPRVLVNQEYHAEVKAGSRSKEDRRFVAECLQNANWLVRNMHQRAQTILRVASEIVSHQQDFLLHGVEHLRPLNLRVVAEAIGIHESTVCRAIANKFMMTNRGMFELKFFFATSISASDGGDDVSAETVRYRIRQIVEAETAQHVLSDDAIVEALRASGIHLARRTVAKYREMMRIPSSQQRRRMKLAGAPV